MSAEGAVSAEFQVPSGPKSSATRFKAYNAMFIGLIMKELISYAGYTSDLTLRFLSKASHQCLKDFPRVRQKIAYLETNPKLLFWAKLNTGMKATLDLCHVAAGFGNVELLLDLKQEMPPRFWADEVWNWRLCASAAKAGNLPLIKFMREQPEPIELNTGVFACAAWGGHLETMEWLHAPPQSCAYDKWACIQAAANGHIEVIEWLRRRSPPCPWDASCCAFAAANGQTQTISWLRSQGCNWDAEASLKAAMNGHLETLQWLLTQEPPCPWHVNDCIHLARRNRQIEVVTWIAANMNDAGEFRPLEGEGEGEEGSDSGDDPASDFEDDFIENDTEWLNIHEED